MSLHIVSYYVIIRQVQSLGRGTFLVGHLTLPLGLFSLLPRLVAGSPLYHFRFRLTLHIEGCAFVGRNVWRMCNVYKDSGNHGDYGGGVLIAWGWVGVELWMIGLVDGPDYIVRMSSRVGFFHYSIVSG
jgi:hypothetical protein